MVVAPVHRSPEGRDTPGESYWYPFYAGYAYLQVPTRAPNDAGFTEAPRTATWLLTRLERENLPRAFRKLPIRSIFEAAEQGQWTTSWEKQLGVISISEGQASFFLLQWLLCQRLLESLTDAECPETIDLASEIKWRYAAQGQPFHERLADIQSLGFELPTQFGLTTTSDGDFVRCADLWQDLQLLGLVDENRVPTERFECLLLWLKARIDCASVTPQQGQWQSLDGAIAGRLGSSLSQAKLLCKIGVESEGPAWVLPRFIWLLLTVVSGSKTIVSPPTTEAGWESLKSVQIGAAEPLRKQLHEFLTSNSSLLAVCRLVPAMHILVRSAWKSPLRWLFVPLNLSGYARRLEEPDMRGGLVRISSGLIIMLEDDTQSLPYQTIEDVNVEGVKDGDAVTVRLNNVLPHLSSMALAELACLQDSIVGAYREWEMQESRFAQVVHFLREISQDLASVGGEDAASVRKVVNILAQQFFIRPGPATKPSQKERIVTDALKAAMDAIATFNAYFIRHYDCRAKLDLEGVDESDAFAELIPYDQQNTGSQNERLRSQAYYSLVWIVLDLLAQRAPYAKGKTLVLTLRTRHNTEENRDVIAFEVQVPGKLSLDWQYPRDSLSDFAGRRGFHNLFANAIALGAVSGALIPSTATTPALIRVSFIRGNA